MWLTEDEKQHIDYLFLEGSSMKTVSEAMALPLNTVRDYIARNYGSSAEKNIFRLEYIKQKLGIKGDLLSDEDAAKIYCHEGVSDCDFHCHRYGGRMYSSCGVQYGCQSV